MSDTPSTAVAPLDAAQLYRRCELRGLDFETTAELEDHLEAIGQGRAEEALRFGIGIRREGFNLYVLGPTGSGRHHLARRLTEERAGGEPVAPDWCYVNNFEQPHKPVALRLPPGGAAQLKTEMEHLVEDLRSAIASVFEGDDYRTRRQDLEQEFKERQESAIKAVQEAAEKEGITLLNTPGGFAFAPTKDGNVIAPGDYEKLPGGERGRIEKAIEHLHERLRQVFRDIPKWQREANRKLRELNREVTLYAVGSLIEELKKKYQDVPEVQAYLDRVQGDVLDNADAFRKQEDDGGGGGLTEGKTPAPLSRRYEVNALVDHGEEQGAPVVYEDHPTFQNLVGRVEHQAQMGTLVTDFTLIKPGALHRANGGYLLLDVRKLLVQPFAYEGLKRALRSAEIRTESIAEALSLVSTVSLEPQPLPLSVKVVLVGERLLYYLLNAYDPEFGSLFKVAADFEDSVDRTPDNDGLYARLVATLARREELAPLQRDAVARVIEHSARLADDAEKLSTHVRSLADLLREADYLAGQAGREAIARDDVETAIAAQIRRADRIRERIQEAVLRDTVLIDTRGERIGQVNGLAVLDLGNFRFGQPARITATARLGSGEVVDIQRESDMGGPIHAKAVLILNAFLAARYAAERPLSLAASLVFEQSYGMVEGDSATVAETCALLSALSGVPLKQSMAVTGSMNQHGQVQAIGGVNEKVEGFFDICARRGLSGEQGVVIPAANVKHLMLRRDVVEAVERGEFGVYPVATLDQALTLLTGLPAGERPTPHEGFPVDTVNGRVERRLMTLYAAGQAFSGAAERGGGKP